jgi:recombination protein RecA
VKKTPKELAAEINKLVPGAVRMGSDPAFEMTVLPTGVLPIDYLLRGGLPRGRMVEIYGDFSTLKTYIALRAIAYTQQQNGTAALIDTEHAFDADWAKACGVSIADLIVQHPPNGETAIDSAELLLRSGLDLLVFDSVAATLPKSEQETKISEKTPQPARLAALMSLALRKLTAANQGETAILWINQTRMQVGVSFGNPETVPGGKALPFYASWRLSLRKAGRVTADSSVYDGSKMKSVKEVRRQTIRAFTEKSKLDRPYKEAYFDFDLTTNGIDEVAFMVNLGVEQGIVIKNGAMWSLKGCPAVRGIENFRTTVDTLKLSGMLNLNGAEWVSPTTDTQTSPVSAGEQPAPNKPAATVKRRRLKRSVPGSTPTQVPGE